MKSKLLIAIFFAVFGITAHAALPQECITLKADYTFVQNLIKEGNIKEYQFEACIKGGGDRAKCGDSAFGYSANKHNELLSEWLAKQDLYFKNWYESSPKSCKMMGAPDLPPKIQGIYTK